MRYSLQTKRKVRTHNVAHPNKDYNQNIISTIGQGKSTGNNTNAAWINFLSNVNAEISALDYIGGSGGWSNISTVKQNAIKIDDEIATKDCPTMNTSLGIKISVTFRRYSDSTSLPKYLQFTTSADKASEIGLNIQNELVGFTGLDLNGSVANYIISTLVITIYN